MPRRDSNPQSQQASLDHVATGTGSQRFRPTDYVNHYEVNLNLLESIYNLLLNTEVVVLKKTADQSAFVMTAAHQKAAVMTCAFQTVVLMTEIANLSV